MNANPIPGAQVDLTQTKMHNNNLEDTDTILIGDTISKDIRTAKMDNYFVPETSVSELTEMMPAIIANQPATKEIVIHTGSHDILRLKQGSEIFKRDFTLLLELLGKLQHHTTISGPIPTLNRTIESLVDSLALIRC